MGQRGWLGVAVLAFLAAPAPGQITIAWKLNQGDKFYVEGVTKQKQVLETMGQKIPQNMTTTNVMSFEIVKKDADHTVLKQTMEDVKIQADGQAAATQQDMAQKMKGAGFTVTLDKSGRIIKMEGVDAFIKRLTGDNEAVAKMVKTMVNEDTFKQMFQEIFAFVPDKPVAKGDTWKRDMAMSLGPMGKFKIGQTYTYEGPGQDGERIGTQSSFSFEPSREEGGLPFKVTKGDFKVEDAKGVIVFDTKAGRVVRQEMMAHIKGSLTLSVMGQEVTMNMDIEQDTKMRVLDKKP